MSTGTYYKDIITYYERLGEQQGPLFAIECAERAVFWAQVSGVPIDTHSLEAIAASKKYINKIIGNTALHAARVLAYEAWIDDDDIDDKDLVVIKGESTKRSARFMVARIAYGTTFEVSQQTYRYAIENCAELIGEEEMAWQIRRARLLSEATAII